MASLLLYAGKKKLLLIVAATVLILQYCNATGDEAGNINIAKPGCQDKCGNISIPYPFGIGHGCFLREGFEVNCQDNIALLNTTYIGPVFEIVLPLLEINLTLGEARVQNFIARTCTMDEFISPVMSTLLPVGQSFVVSRTKNVFIAVGCSTIALIKGYVGGTTNKGNILDVNSLPVSLCGSFCQEDSIDNSTECFGRGCCQSAIPRNLKSFVPSFLNYSNNAVGQYFSPCSYAFVAEVGWFKFDPSYVRSQTLQQEFGFGPPLVLDWVVGDVSCEEAAAGTSKMESSYACVDRNSVCIDVPNGSGHRCNCSSGYQGNPYLAGGCQDINECDYPWIYPCKGQCRNTIGSYLCSCPSGTRSKDPKNTACTAIIGISIGIGVGSAAGFISLVLIAIFLTKRFKNKRARKLKQKFFNQNRGLLLKQLVSQRADIAERMIVSLDELEKATNNFDKARELGGGGHGTVYKGILSDLHVVAIKKSNIVVEKEITEFINEVAILSQISHKNIVKLIGCCLETEVPLLIYEFISNGTLYHRLHAEGERSLSWSDRLRIACEVANALSYLHSSVSVPIVHRDIKSSNILLHDNLISKVSDFGASRYIPIEKTGLTTMVQGTIGYLDPMYFYTGRLNDKSDVYSFGVVLVELLTKKKTFPVLSSEGDGLVEKFVRLHGAGNLVQILDPQVIAEGSNQVQEVAKLTASCIKLRSEDRPTMKQVNCSLEGIMSSGKYVEDRILVANQGQSTMPKSTTWHSY